MTPRSISLALGLAGSMTVFGCGSDGERDTGSTTFLPTGGGSGGSDGSSGGSDGDSGASGADSSAGTSGGETASGGGDGDGDGDGDSNDAGGTGDDGIRLDVGGPGESGSGADGGQACDPSVQDDCGCTAVDILFIVDNSRSMGDYQAALAGAFPQFVDAIVAALPPGTDVHVGITTSEMNDSRDSNQGPPYCGAPADADFWYLTPDERDTGKNGTQGRLHAHDGQAFYAFRTDDPPTALDAASTWFQSAALVGEGGSNAEQPGAAAGWAADPANAGSNAGFIRDEGAVLVLFFIGDEHDQTPTAAGPELLNKLSNAKAACGGVDCIVGGGFVRTACLPTVPMGTILDGLSEPPVVAEIPNEDTVTANDFAPLLRDTLSQVIAKKCDEIEPPVG